MSSIEDLKAVITAKGGLAKANQFLVQLPAFGDTSEANILCTSATLPGKQVLTHDRKINMEFEKIAYGYAVTEASFTFLMVNDYSMKKYFDRWRKTILDEENMIVGYKNDYQRPVRIHQLKRPFVNLKANLGPLRFSLNLGSDSVYGVELRDAFPVTFNEINLNNELDGLVQYSVAMAFTNWYPVSEYDRQVQLSVGIGSNQLINAAL